MVLMEKNMKNLDKGLGKSRTMILELKTEKKNGDLKKLDYALRSWIFVHHQKGLVDSNPKILDAP